MPTRSHLTRPRPRQAIIHLIDTDDPSVDEVITITYDSNRLTPRWIEESNQRDAEQDPLSIARALEYVMLGWDVTEDDGTEWPPVAKNLAEFSYTHLVQLMDQMVDASLPGAAEGEGSGSSSATPQPDSSSGPELPQNGSTLSTSPLPSGVASPK